jgi:DNA helicase-2/ATP-dependent DNA helicase PcrA
MPKAKAVKKTAKTEKVKALVKNEGKLFADLNPAQANAVGFGEGPLLIVAGAGTGKTTVITRRIAHLISQGVKPDEILALTFTEKAAAEMEERVDVLLPYGYYDLWVSTFHAFCDRILKQHALDIGISNDYKLLDNVQQWLLVRQNFDRFKLNYYKPLGNPTKFINAMLRHFSKAKDEEISPEEYLKFAEALEVDINNEAYDTEEEVQRVKEIAHAYSVYQELLLENNAMDFGDLINYTLKLFRNRGRILSFYQKKFKFILVDEFQDTNYAQYELVKLLAGGHGNLNVVGDDDQSIYKFRGASVSNIIQFKKDFPTTRDITLVENYRSSQNILDMAYNFIQQNNPDRLEAKLAINKKLEAATKEEGVTAVISGQTLSDEVELVVKKMAELKKEKDTTWNDFAILVRANDQADVFISKLNALGIPYTFFANKGLYKKAIIVDLVAYLKLLLDYHDSACLYRVLNMEAFRVDHGDLVNIMHHGHKKTMSLFEALNAASQVAGVKEQSVKRINELLALIKKHGEMVLEKNVVEVFISIVKDLRIANRIKEDTYENLENRELLEQFYKKIEQFEAENIDRSTKNFLDFLNFEQEAGEEGKINFDPNQGPESVKIMTIHSSKGLEFKNVFIVNMVHLRFPSMNRSEAIEIPKELVKEPVPDGDIHLQEERRLFYVAMTRAKRRLFFTYALDYGGQRARKPSPFLVDIGLVAKPEKSTEVLNRAKFDVNAPIDPNVFLPTTFSYSQLADFKRCPMKYKYRHLYHLPLPGGANLSFGSTIHVTLEKFLNMYKGRLETNQLDLFVDKIQKQLPSYEELEKIYENCWIDEWYESKKQKEDFKKRGYEIIKSFYSEFEKNPIRPKYIEKSFRLNLDKYFFTGKIDRADLLPDNSLQIIDYKTGQNKLEKKEDKQQLLIYQWAAQEYLTEKVSQLNYWFLLDNTKSEPLLGTPEEIEELKAGLLETIEEIRYAVAHNTFKQLDAKVQHQCEFEELD